MDDAVQCRKGLREVDHVFGRLVHEHANEESVAWPQIRIKHANPIEDLRDMLLFCESEPLQLGLSG